MKVLIYFTVLAMSMVFSCTRRTDKSVEKVDKVSVAGKWYRFTMANGYTEFDIDSQNVVFYNQKVGRFKLPYILENDSLKYLTNQYAARIQHFGDSIYLEGNDSTTAMLYKFNQQSVPFNSIPEESDSSSFAAYVKGFDKRLVAEFVKAGINISDPAGKNADATYEELLKNKSRP